MADQKPALTAQQQIAQKITDALIEKKLISENKKNKLPQQISMGLLDSDDWALLVDMATEQDANNQQEMIPSKDK